MLWYHNSSQEQICTGIHYSYKIKTNWWDFRYVWFIASAVTAIAGVDVEDHDNLDECNAKQLKEFVINNLKNTEVKDEHKVPD